MGWRADVVRACLLTMAASCLFGLAGCGDDNGNRHAAFALSHPIPLDAGERIEIGRWWVGNGELLQITENVYSIHPDESRYRPPRERGTWSYEEGDELQLRPIGDDRDQPQRTAVVRMMRGQRALFVDDLPPFFAQDEPPQVIEDELVGQWHGDGMSLDLVADGRYHLQSHSESVQVTLRGRGETSVPSHRGRWEYAGGYVLLMPESIDVDHLAVRVHDDRRSPIRLSFAGEQLTSQGVLAVPEE